MKKLLFALGCVWLILSMNTAAYAASSRVIDDAGLLGSSDISSLEQMASSISEKYNTNVFILTSNESGYSSNYARDLIQDYGETNYPEGYIGMMIDMNDRSYWIDAYGSQMTEWFDNDYIDKITDNVYDNLRSGNYSGAFETFLENVSKRLEVKASPLGFLKKLYLYPVWTLGIVAVSLGGAALIAWMWTSAKASGHKDKGIATQAGAYGGDLRLNQNEDRFVRTYQTRVRMPENNGGHGGGGGFGGGGGGGGGHTGGGGHF